MGQTHSQRQERKELFGDKTGEHFQNNYTEAKRKSEKRRKQKLGETVIFKQNHHFARQPIFERPICLISTDDAGNCNIEEEALRQLREIDLPLVIVAIAGLYRTGKSYLMNRLAGKSEGFALGSTIQSKTKGIWVWCRRHPQLANTVLMLLDTEGLGDVAKSDIGHDNRIFTLAVLMCNVLVYNMMHAFNQDAVEKLTFIAEMSRNISFKNKIVEDNADDKLILILPEFVLCLRDFTLALEMDGEELTADEYLERCLQPKPGEDAGNEKFNKPRECIMKYFARRKCFTFDSPGSRSVIQKLEQMDLKDLSQDFRNDTDKFLAYIYNCEPKQLLLSKPVNGQMFVTLAESYVKAIKDGGVPDVDDAFLAVSNLENDRLAKEAVQEFKKRLGDIKLPIPQENDLDQLRQDFVDESLEQFRSQALFKSEEFEKRAIAEMNSLWNDVKTENRDLARKFCEKQLDDVYIEMLEEKIRNKKYQKPGGLDKFKKDLRKLEEEFKKRVKGFDDIVIKSIICSLLENLQKTEEEIMNFDKKLNEEEKENLRKQMQQDIDAAKEEQKKLVEQQQRAEEMREKDHQRQLDETRQHYEKQEKEKMQFFKKQLDDQREQQEKIVDTLREEQRKQTEAFKEEQRKQAEVFKEEQRRQEDARKEEQRRRQAEENDVWLNVRVKNPFKW